MTFNEFRHKVHTILYASENTVICQHNANFGHGYYEVTLKRGTVRHSWRFSACSLERCYSPRAASEEIWSALELLEASVEGELAQLQRNEENPKDLDQHDKGERR